MYFANFENGSKTELLGHENMIEYEREFDVGMNCQ